MNIKNMNFKKAEGIFVYHNYSVNSVKTEVLPELFLNFHFVYVSWSNNYVFVVKK